MADESRISHRVSLDQSVPVLETKSNDPARAPSKANRKNCPLAKATIPGKVPVSCHPVDCQFVPSVDWMSVSGYPVTTKAPLPKATLSRRAVVPDCANTHSMASLEVTIRPFVPTATKRFGPDAMLEKYIPSGA